MCFYRTSFPEASVPPKFHMLEEHVVPWLREMGNSVAFGLMGEQGAESIHRWFNKEGEKYATLTDGVTRLNSMMKHHFVNITPSNTALKPLPKKRKFTQMDTN